jgi:hypothetical protein
MSLSRDSRTLTYEVRVTDRGRDMRWTEVYEKQCEFSASLRTKAGLAYFSLK